MVFANISIEWCQGKQLDSLLPSSPCSSYSTSPWGLEQSSHSWLRFNPRAPSARLHKQQEGWNQMASALASAGLTIWPQAGRELTTIWAPGTGMQRACMAQVCGKRGGSGSASHTWGQKLNENTSRPITGCCISWALEAQFWLSFQGCQWPHHCTVRAGHCQDKFCMVFWEKKDSSL